MKRLLIFIFFLKAALLIAQNDINNYIESNYDSHLCKNLGNERVKPISASISAGAFMPIKFNEDYKLMLPALSIGGQYNTSELFSLCMDLNISVTKIKKPIIQLLLGPKFHFFRQNNKKFFAKVEIGAFSTEDRKFLPFTSSIGIGYVNKISDKLSFNFEISQNTLLSFGATEVGANTFLLILGGICINL